MEHPNSDWKDEETHPMVLKKSKRRFLDRDIRFSLANREDRGDLFKCFIWELYRTINFCDEMPPSLDSKTEFPFCIKSFPARSYLSHSYDDRKSWVTFEMSESSKYEEKLLLPWGMDTQTIGKKSPIFFPRSKLPLQLYVNPNWTRSKLLRLFEEQIKEISEEIQSEKKRLERSRMVVPFVHAEYMPGMRESDFRKLVEEVTENVCRLVTVRKKSDISFKTKKHKFESKPKRFGVAGLNSRLKILGHYRLSKCVGLSWLQTQKEFKGKAEVVPAFQKPLASEKKFKDAIKKNKFGLPM
jgi:hypothetical protein